MGMLKVLTLKWLISADSLQTCPFLFLCSSLIGPQADRNPNDRVISGRTNRG